MKKRTLFAGAAIAAMLAPAALGQVIMSPDGMWAATLDANGTGQITNLNLNGTDNVFETLWYEASGATGGVTRRIENTYTPVSQNVGANSADFTMRRNAAGMQLDVNVTMIDGSDGGARFRLTWTNTGANPEDVKPFAYSDFDVAASAGGDDASWDMANQALVQSDDGISIYFGGTQTYKSWEITTFAGLRTALDAGRAQLLNSGGGANADFTSALAGETLTLNPGQTLTFTFQMGGLAPAPGALAFLGLAGLARRRRR